MLLINRLIFLLVFVAFSNSIDAESSEYFHPLTNDDCSGAIAIPVEEMGSCQGITATNCGATDSEKIDSTIPEPVCGAYQGGDVWFSVSVAYGETVTIEGSMGGAMALYIGACNSSQLDLIECNKSPLPKLTFTNVYLADTNVLIRYWDIDNDEMSDFHICAYIDSPPNDSPNDARGIEHLNVCQYLVGTSLNATETYPGCVGTADDDVWYKFVATNESAIIEVQGNGTYDAVLEFYSDPLAEPLSCTNQTLGGGLESYMATNLIPGNLYYYRIYDYCPYTISPSDWTFTTCVYGGVSVPTNDECSGAIEIPITNGQGCLENQTNIRATTSLQETVFPFDPSSRDVWFFVPLTRYETLRIDFEPLGSYGDMAIYTGNCNEDGLMFIDADYTSFSAPVISLSYTNFQMDDTLYIRIGLNWRHYDVFNICAAITPPLNDECTTAVEVKHLPYCNEVTGTSLNATQSTYSCIGTAEDDVWYKFVASNTTAIIEVTGVGDYDPVLEFYSGCDTLVDFSCTDNSGKGGREIYEAFGLTVGKYYYFRIFDYWSPNVLPPVDWGFTTCVYGGASPPPNDDCIGAIFLPIGPFGPVPQLQCQMQGQQLRKNLTLLFLNLSLGITMVVMYGIPYLSIIMRQSRS
ncbi:MAG: hypothetical protein KDC53_13085 [Saprospiraceae bacterium]|nr:hypothetical protein [Saprospiraceae bacterium]